MSVLAKTYLATSTAIRKRVEVANDELYKRRDSSYSLVRAHAELLVLRSLARELSGTYRCNSFFDADRFLSD